jgi:glycosyltransferase involved in cell wall biosynthesis
MTDSDDYVNYLTHGENVYFVHDNDPITLSKALCELFESTEKMKAIGNGGKRFAMDHFNYHKTTKGLLEFILY